MDGKVDIMGAMKGSERSPSPEYLAEVNKRKAIVDNHFISLSEHSKSIAEYINNSDQFAYEEDLYTWFRIAGSIRSIDYEGIDYRGYFYDKAILAYEEENNELYAELVKEATVFIYLYNGLENLIKKLDLPEDKQRKGRINSAAIFITKHFNGKPNGILYHDDLLNNCVGMYCTSIDKDYKVSDEYYDLIDTNGIGVKFLYRLRNRLMHGDFLFPEPDGCEKYPFHTQTINSCSRLLLMCVQLLLIATLGDTSASNIFDIYTPNYREIPDNFIINEADYLRKMHLEIIE